jgi:hypothetical protein
MAKILTFRPAGTRRDEGGFTSADASAEVIVFPGIRYERWGDAEGAPASPAKKQSRDRQRDILELAE